MTSASERQELLDLLYNVLNEPEKYGDKFLVEIVNRSKDGMIAVSSLQNMAVVLNEYPKAYFIHCIPLDEKHRFRQSCDGSKVGLLSHPSNVETDEFGFVKYDDDPVTIVRDSIRQSVMSQLTDLDELSLKRNSVMPVVYSDGKFYIDVEPNKNSDMDEDPDVPKFKYDKVDIKPIGLRGEINRFEDFIPNCYNCGSEDHRLIDCQLPINKFKVAKNKRKRNHDSVPAGRRLYLELDLQDKISKVAPGILSDTLKEALGMRSDDDEPPYYRNMRANGYPPGYIGKEGYQIPYGSKMTLDDVINTKAPLLKVYRDDGTDYESEDTKEDISSSISKPQNVKLVYYPGLNFVDTSKLDQYKVFQSNAQATSNRKNVQNHWGSYYAQQRQYYPSQHVYPLEQQIYPPGTQVQNNYYNSPNNVPAASQTETINLSLADPAHNSFNPSSSHIQTPIEANSIPKITPMVDESDDDMDISSDDGN